MDTGLGKRHARDRILARQSDDYFEIKRGCFFGGGGGGGGDDAAEKAAEAQLQSTREALALEREIFNRQLQAQAPGRNIGNQALATLGGLYGFDPNIDIAPIDPLSEGMGEYGGYQGGSSGGSFNQNALAQGGNIYARPGLQGRPWGAGSYTQPMGQAAQSAGMQSGGMSSGGSNWQPSITAGSGQSLLDLDPGYAFRLKEGEQALNRQAAAAGKLYSGAQLKAAQRYGQDYSSNEYTNAYNRLASLAGLQQTGTQGVSNALASFGDTSTGLIQRGGDARASGYINAANAAGPSFGARLGSGVVGAAGGALTGAEIGAAGGPIGIGGGALLGGLAGLFS